MSEKNKNDQLLDEFGERTQEFIEQKTGGKELIEDFSREKLVDILKESPKLTEKLKETKRQLKEALGAANLHGESVGYKLQLSALQQELDQVLEEYHDRKEGRTKTKTKETKSTKKIKKKTKKTKEIKEEKNPKETKRTKEEVEEKEKKLPGFVVDYLYEEIGRKIRFGHYLKFRKALIGKMTAKGDVDEDLFKNKHFSNKVHSHIDRLFFNTTYTLEEAFSDHIDGDSTVRINRLEYLTVKMLLDLFTQHPPASKQEMHKLLAAWMATGWQKAAENEDIYSFIKDELRELVASHKNNQSKKNGGKKKPTPDLKKTTGVQQDSPKTTTKKNLDKKNEVKTVYRNVNLEKRSISTGAKIIPVKTKPLTDEIKDATTSMKIDGKEERVYINSDALKDILVIPNNTFTLVDKETDTEVLSVALNKESAPIFTVPSSPPRTFVVTNINGQLVPFYRSSRGTGGKKKGKWYPFFGFTGAWLVKGPINQKTGDMNYSPEIERVADILNKNLVFPDVPTFVESNRYFKCNRLGNKTDVQAGGRTSRYKIKRLDASTNSRSGLVALMTGLDPANVDDRDKDGKALQERLDTIIANAATSKKTKEKTPKTVGSDTEGKDTETVDPKETKTGEKKTIKKKTKKSEKEKPTPKETSKKVPKEIPKEKTKKASKETSKETSKEAPRKKLTPEQREKKTLDDYYKKIEKTGLKIGGKTRKATRSYTYLQEGKSATFNIVDEGYPGNGKVVITPAGRAFALEDGGLKEKHIENISPLGPEYAWTGELWEKKIKKDLEEKEETTSLEKVAHERMDSPSWLNSAYFEGADKAYLERFTTELKDAVDTATENYPNQNMFKAVRHQLSMNGLGATHFWNTNVETLDEFLPLEITNELRDILAERKSWWLGIVTEETSGKRFTELKEHLLEDITTGERYHDRFVGESLRAYIEQMDRPSSDLLSQIVGEQAEQVDTAIFEKQEFIDTCIRGAIKEHAHRLQEKEGTYRLSPEKPTQALIEQLSETHQQRIDSAMKARMMSRDEYLQKNSRIKRLKQKKLRAENIFSKGWASIQLGTAKFFKGIQHRLLSIGKKKEKSSEAHAAEKVYPTDAWKLFSSYTHTEENTALSQKLGLKNVQIVPGEDGKLQAKLTIGKKNVSVSLPEEKLYQGDELFKGLLTAKQLKDDQEKIAASWGLLKSLIMSITHKHGAIRGTVMNRELTIRAETGSVEVWIDAKRTFTEEQFLQLDPHEALEEVMLVWRMLQGAMEDQYEQMQEQSELLDIGIDRRARKKLQADLLDEYDTLPRITVGTKQVEKTVEEPATEGKENKEKGKNKNDSSDKPETGEGDSEETKEEKSEEKKNSKEQSKNKEKQTTTTVSVSEYTVPPLTEENQSLNYFVIEDGVSGDERVVYSDGNWYRIKGADSAPEVVEEYENLQALFASGKVDNSTFLKTYTSNYLKHYFKLPRNTDRTVYFSHYGRRFQVKQTGSRGEFAVEVVSPTDELVGLAEEMPVYPQKRRRRNQPHRSENTAGFQYTDGTAQAIAIDNKDSEGHVRYTEKELTDDEKLTTKTADLGMFGSYPLTETLIATCNMTLRL